MGNSLKPVCKNKKKRVQPISQISRYASFSIVAGPLLEPYALSQGGLPLYKLFMAVNVVFFLYYHIQHHIKVSSVPGFQAFIAYSLVVPSVIAILTGLTSGLTGSWIVLLLFTANLYLAVPLCDFDELRRYYKFWVFFASLIFLLQEISFLTLGQRFIARIPGIPLPYDIPVGTFRSRMMNLDRSCSLFLEPSHFAHFLVPYLAIKLGELHDKTKVIDLEAFFLSLILVFLRSGNGLIMLAVLWLLVLVFANMNRFVKMFVLIPISTIIILGGIFILSRTDAGQELLERTEELNADVSQVSSGTMRVYRGFWVYADQRPVVKLFGIGYGGKDDAIDHSRFSWMFQDNERYINNASVLLLCYGIIGTLLFFMFLIRICKRNSFGAFLLVSVFVVLCFMEAFWGDTRMLLYIAIPIIMKLRSSKSYSGAWRQISSVSSHSRLRPDVLPIGGLDLMDGRVE